MKTDPVYAICCAGFLVSESGFMLGLVFVNAWTSQFFIKSKEGLDGAKDLSETIATWAMFFGIVMGGVIGYSIDGKNKRIMPWLFSCFAFRFVGLFVMTVIIDDY